MPSLPRKARILVVDQNPTTRDNLAKLLYFVPSVEVVGLAGSGQEAIAQATQLHPDSMIIDLALPDGDITEVLETLVSHLPQVRIIATSTAGAAHYLVSPLSSAVRVLLIKPITAEALTKAIRFVSQS